MNTAGQTRQVPPVTTEPWPRPPEGRRGWRRRLPAMTVVAVVAVAVAAAGLVATAGDDEDGRTTTAGTVLTQPDGGAGAPVVTAPQPAAPTTAPTPAAPTSVPQPATPVTTAPAPPDRSRPPGLTYRPQAVWPETLAELDRLQGAVDQGHQPWRNDPVEVARAYLAERGLPTAGLGPFARASAETGSVEYTVANRGGRVDLQRLMNGSIWYVTGSRSATFPGVQIQRQGATVAVTVQSGVAGTLAVRAKRPGTDWGPAERRETLAGARWSVTVPAEGDVIVQVRFEDTPGLAEVFLGQGTAGTQYSALDAESRLRVDGVGPVNIGMSLQAAQAASGLPMSYGEAGACAGFRTYEPPTGLHLTAVEGSGRVDFIDVSEPSIATVSGIRVGSTLAEVRRTYGDRLKGSVQDGWGKLVFRADDPVLDRFAMAFLFSEGKVAGIWAGLRTAVERDEICA